jgi:hypothetical protein
VAAGIGAAPVLVSQDPAVIVTGVAAGALLEPSAEWLFQRIGGAMAGRRHRVLNVASETAGMSSEELYRRIVEDEQKQVLAAKAIEAAMRTAVSTSQQDTVVLAVRPEVLPFLVESARVNFARAPAARHVRSATESNNLDCEVDESLRTVHERFGLGDGYQRYAVFNIAFSRDQLAKCSLCGG